MFSAESLANFLNQWGIVSILVSLVISIVIAIVGVLPSIFITGANVILFGPLNGLLVSWLGETLGAAVSFYLYRLGFKRRTELLSKKYSLLNKITATKGLLGGILIFQARLLPFIPSGFITLAGAISNIRFTTFLLASALGKLPSITLEALVSYDFVNLHQNWLRLLITLFALLLTFLFLKNKFSKK